ncbi:PQQ-binding-like beta-propeller repeat protein [Fuerstiella marisgermanici]|uniref:Polyvinylalcohol dehydrogenase n=1 Tax=Fuerstiella marisgermanici TaxID=1891926 RepID=A0A1P8WS73_9PLAN|nr:PQQ-binding-like beta-propeller repeat protein [Fuerstiella marisgermanici]APZ96907.1 Polyvinylalcohol dehydrogenase precursor [Fuerstiella marisgermanici]
MKPLLLLTCLLVIPAPLDAGNPGSDSSTIEVGAQDWPWWRGPHRNGIASSDQHPPLKWSETENVLWKVAVPGRGHGSATVVGDQVFLASADHETEQQAVHCYDRQTGEELWKTVVHKGGFTKKGNEKASLASTTVACDGENLFVNFLNDGAVYTTSLDRNGKQLWQTKISDYVVHQGYGSSPAPYKNLVIVSADNKGGGAIAGLERATGKIAWKRTRPEKPNYPSPIILNVAGKDQLLMTGCDLVTSLDPLTGEENWEIEGATTECVTSTVTDGTRIFTSGGYPKNHIAAVAADGSGKVVWENTVRTYVPSMLVKDGYLYAALDAGIATCRKSDTGEEVWKGRLAGTFSSSPVLVGDRIYATNEEGTTFVFKATPDKFVELARNKLGESVFATPTICGSRIYARVTHKIDGKRQEFLYCLGEK